MTPSELFQHCPRCGQSLPPREGRNHLDCGRCGLRYYFNPTVAAAAFVHRADGALLWIRRARDPARGKLAPPGGFIDIGETVEEALRREVREEVGIELVSMQFLISQPNTYPYREITYPVLDLFFVAEAAPGAVAFDPGEVTAAEWIHPQHLNPEDLAFTSTRAAFEHLRRHG